MHLPLASLFGPENWMLIAFFGLLIFGRRLPEVGRSLGKGIVEFKKGLAGIEEDVSQSGKTGVSTMDQGNRAALPGGYKFDPYTGKPLAQEPVASQGMRFDPYTGKPLDQSAPSNSASNV